MVAYLIKDFWSSPSFWILITPETDIFQVQIIWLERLVFLLILRLLT